MGSARLGYNKPSRDGLHMGAFLPLRPARRLDYLDVNRAVDAFTFPDTDEFLKICSFFVESLF